MKKKTFLLKKSVKKDYREEIFRLRGSRTKKDMKNDIASCEKQGVGPIACC